MRHTLGGHGGGGFGCHAHNVRVFRGWLPWARGRWGAGCCWPRGSSWRLWGLWGTGARRVETARPSPSCSTRAAAGQEPPKQDMHLGGQRKGWPGSRAANDIRLYRLSGKSIEGRGRNGASEAVQVVTARVVRRSGWGAGSLCHMFRPPTPRHGSVRDKRPWLPG